MHIGVGSKKSGELQRFARKTIIFMPKKQNSEKITM